MILLKISVLLVTCVIGKVFTDVLHCYECEDCKTSNHTFLRACPQILGTTTPSDSVPDAAAILTTSTAPSSITTEPSDTTVAAAEPESTLAPSLPSITVSTAADVADEIKEDDTAEMRKRSIRQVNYRALMAHRFAREVSVSHHCYSIKGYGGDPRKIKRGCVQATGNKNACDVLKEQYDVPLERCQVCTKSRCNNSAVRSRYFMSYQVLVLLVVFLVKIGDNLFN